VPRNSSPQARRPRASLRPDTPRRFRRAPGQGVSLRGDGPRRREGRREMPILLLQGTDWGESAWRCGLTRAGRSKAPRAWRIAQTGTGGGYAGIGPSSVPLRFDVCPVDRPGMGRRGHVDGFKFADYIPERGLQVTVLRRRAGAILHRPPAHGVRPASRPRAGSSGCSECGRGTWSRTRRTVRQVPSFNGFLSAELLIPLAGFDVVLLVPRKPRRKVRRNKLPTGL
jgi:hypothetical protein